MIALLLTLFWRWLRRCFRIIKSGSAGSAASVSRPVDLEASAVACLELLATASDEDSISTTAAYRACAVVLAAPYAASFPAALGTLLSDSCPHPLLGGLHVSQVVTVHSVRVLLKRLSIGGEKKPLATATWSAEDDAPHRRGVLAALITTLSGGGGWSGNARLLFSGGRAPASSAALTAATTTASASLPTDADDSSLLACSPTRVALTADVPAVWAVLSEDVNPIHTSPAAAWLLGFRSGGRVVAHGMSVVLLALPVVFAALAASLVPPHAADAAAGGGDAARREDAATRFSKLLEPAGRLSLRLEVHFARPLFAPGALAVRTGAVADVGDSGASGREHRTGSDALARSVAFVVSQADDGSAAAPRVHVRGRVEMHWRGVSADEAAEEEIADSDTDEPGALAPAGDTDRTGLRSRRS